MAPVGRYAATRTAAYKLARIAPLSRMPASQPASAAAPSAAAALSPAAMGSSVEVPDERAPGDASTTLIAADDVLPSSA